jgi:transposase-like protein
MPKRKHYTAEFKTRVVLELLTAEKGLMQASREYGIKDTILSRWKQEFMERAPQVFNGGVSSEGQADEQRIAELERMVGKLTVELDLAKKALGYSNWIGRQSGE